MNRLATLLAALALTACTRVDIVPPTTEYLIQGTHVSEFKLQDGTRCVVTLMKESLTCDWARAGEKPE